MVSVSLFAQTATAPKPEFYWIHEEIAKPGMVAEYESATREILGILSAQNADPKRFGMQLYMSPDAHYFFVAPISGYSSVESFFPNLNSIGESAGKAKWDAVMARSNAALLSMNDSIAIRRHDLEYMPASPRLQPQEVRFIHLLYFYPDAAHTADLEQVGRDYAAFFKSKNVADPFRVYEVVTGTDLPLYIVAIPGRSAADYYAQDERMNAALGNELRALQARSMANLRKFEMRDVWARPDMSYPLPATK